MKKAYIITEGRLDAEMLKKLLPTDAVRDIEFVVGDSRYSALSLARTLLADRHIPVALVLDADTLDEIKIQEQRDFLEELLSQASSGTKFEVFLAKPEIETLFVENPNVVERLTNRHYSKTELSIAKLRPKKFLALEMRGKALMKNVDDKMIQAIRKHPLISDLSKFLSSVAA